MAVIHKEQGGLYCVRNNLLTRNNSASSNLRTDAFGQKFIASVEGAKYKFKELNRRHLVFKNLT